MDKTKFLIHLIVIFQIAFIIVSLTLHDSYYSVSFAYFVNNTLYDNGTSQVGSVNDTNGSSNITKSVTISSQNVKIPTDGGSVDVLVQPSPFPLTIGDSKFKVSFSNHRVKQYRYILIMMLSLNNRIRRFSVHLH